MVPCLGHHLGLMPHFPHPNYRTGWERRGGTTLTWYKLASLHCFEKRGIIKQDLWLYTWCEVILNIALGNTFFF